jgi:protein-tyrosine phosphatase
MGAQLSHPHPQVTTEAQGLIEVENALRAVERRAKAKNKKNKPTKKGKKRQNPEQENGGGAGMSTADEANEFKVLICRKLLLSHLPSSILEWQYIGYLQELDLSNNNLSDLDMELAKVATNLRRLDLSHNKFGVIPSVIPHLTSLVELRLSYNQIASKRVSEEDQSASAPVWSTLTNLKSLYLSFNLLTTVPAHAQLLELASNHSLHFLAIQRNFIDLCLMADFLTAMDSSGCVTAYSYQLVPQPVITYKQSRPRSQSDNSKGAPSSDVSGKNGNENESRNGNGNEYGNENIKEINANEKGKEHGNENEKGDEHVYGKYEEQNINEGETNMRSGKEQSGEGEGEESQWEKEEKADEDWDISDQDLEKARQKLEHELEEDGAKLFLGSLFSAENLTWLEEHKVYYILSIGEAPFKDQRRTQKKTFISRRNTNKNNKNNKNKNKKTQNNSNKNLTNNDDNPLNNNDSVNAINNNSEEKLAKEKTQQGDENLMVRGYPKHYVSKFLALADTPDARLDSVLDVALAFIDNALETGNSVLVHCAAGVSRSASVVIAYLMLKKNYSFDEAFSTTKRARPCISPNHGFLEQLQALDPHKKVSNNNV